MKNTIKEYQVGISKSIDFLKDELISIRAGRANPHILDRVIVSYYGADTPLKQMANISAPEPRIIQVNPYDATTLKDIEKAILMADLGVNPSNDGKVIRIMMPILTEERRVELTKIAKSSGESCKVAIRNERRTAIDKLKKMNKNSEISEDDLARAEKEVQDLTDKAGKEIDEVVSKKEAEILEV